MEYHITTYHEYQLKYNIGTIFIMYNCSFILIKNNDNKLIVNIIHKIHKNIKQ